MDQDFQIKVEGYRFVIPVGAVIYGYCEGVFGEDINHDDVPNPPKRIEAVGNDWLVVRYVDWNNGTQPMYARFADRREMEECIEAWMVPQDSGMADNG